jgi:hypothetical protein
MKVRRAVRALIALYPRRWRRRYGPELEDLTLAVIAHGDSTPTRALLNLTYGVATEHLRARPLSVPLATAALLTVLGISEYGPSAISPLTPQPVVRPIAAVANDLRQFSTFGLTYSTGNPTVTVASMTGAPVAAGGSTAIVLDPNTDRAQSISPAGTS